MANMAKTSIPKSIYLKMRANHEVLVMEPVPPHDLQKCLASESIVEIEAGEAQVTALHLVISPYTKKAHLLDLRTVDVQESLLAHALQHMDALRDTYATDKYDEAFNFPAVIDDLRRRAKAINHLWEKRAFYVVVFRSQVPPTTDLGHLGDLDKAAHAEAVSSGGFLK